MTGWAEFIAAFVVFFASHVIPIRPGVKGPIVARIGARGFTTLYAILSTVILIWLIVAAGRAPQVMLWEWALWQIHIPLSAMLPATLLITMSLGRPNPLSFGGLHNERFDPDHPGIVGWVRHPLLAALAIWAGAHMVPNGDLAHVILFGLFFGFALLGMRIIDKRKRRLMPEWQRLTKTARRIEITPGGLVRFAVGCGIYGLLLWLHTPVIGVSPLP
jgi:uncharacterized membrane protein